MEIQKASERELRLLKHIYLEAFPKAERKPFGIMKHKAGQGVMELLAIREKGRLLGLAFSVLYRDLVLLDYFAIDQRCRGQSYGSEALRLLKERYRDQRFVLEIERPDANAPNQEERLRRKQFYLKNGMQETGIYVSVFRVPMELLTDGKPLTYEEYHQVYEKAVGTFFARRVMRL